MTELIWCYSIDGQVSALEFRMTDGKKDSDPAARRAIAQIHEKGYAEKYLPLGNPAHLVGVTLSTKDHNLAAVKAVAAR